MKIRLNEDYYFWCCDWCDTENRVLWTKLQEGANCGACHRPIILSGLDSSEVDCSITVGLH